MAFSNATIRGKNLKRFTGIIPFAVAAVALLAILYLPVFALDAYYHTQNDYADHIRYAGWIGENPGRIPAHILSHPLFQVLVLAVSRGMGIPLELSAVIVLFGSVLTLVWIIFSHLVPSTRMSDWQCLGIGLGILMASPVFGLFFLDHQAYFGYIGINSYHNPTILLLKPFAVLIFLGSIRLFEPDRQTLGFSLGMAAAVLLSGLTKPNLILCLLPALSLMAVFRWLRGRVVQWLPLAVVLLSTVLVLIAQYLLTYPAGDSGIAVAPFVVMGSYSGYLFPKFLLSILFPLGLGIIYWREARKDPALVLAWLVMGFGLILTYGFSETGRRFPDGNFVWSGEISLFILFFASTVFFLQRKAQTKYSQLDFLLVGLWSSHVLFGIAYYIFNLLRDRL